MVLPHESERQAVGEDLRLWQVVGPHQAVALL
jgi:hypothetical protein